MVIKTQAITEDQRRLHPDWQKLIASYKKPTTFRLIDKNVVEMRIVSIKPVQDHLKNDNVVLGEFEDVANTNPLLYEFINGQITIQPSQVKKMEFFVLHPANRNSPFNSQAYGGISLWEEVDESIGELESLRTQNFKVLATEIVQAMSLADLKTYLAGKGLPLAANASELVLRNKVMETVTDHYLFVLGTARTDQQKLFAQVAMNHKVNTLQYRNYFWYFKDRILCEVQQNAFADEELIKFIRAYYVDSSEKIPLEGNLRDSVFDVFDLVTNVFGMQLQSDNDFSPKAQSNTLLKEEKKK